MLPSVGGWTVALSAPCASSLSQWPEFEVSERHVKEIEVVVMYSE